MAAPSVAVIRPFRPQPESPPVHPARLRNRDWTRQWWQKHFPAWQLIEAGDGREGAFSRSAAKNTAARLADAEILVFIDVDLIPAPSVIAAAAQLATEKPWVVPHVEIEFLSARSTFGVTKFGESLSPGHCELEFHAINPEPAGVFAIRRTAFEKSGGMDERFIGEGEDFAFTLLLNTLIGPYTRLDGCLFHLWHPRRNHPCDNAANTTEASRMLLRRYMRAYGDPNAMREIPGEPTAVEADKPAKEEALRQLGCQLSLLGSNTPGSVAANVRLIPAVIEAINEAPVDPLIWSGLYTYARAIDDGFLTSEGLIVPRRGLQAPLSRIAATL